MKNLLNFFLIMFCLIQARSGFCNIRIILEVVVKKSERSLRESGRIYNFYPNGSFDDKFYLPSSLKMKIISLLEQYPFAILKQENDKVELGFKTFSEGGKIQLIRGFLPTSDTVVGGVDLCELGFSENPEDQKQYEILFQELMEANQSFKAFYKPLASEFLWPGEALVRIGDAAEQGGGGSGGVPKRARLL